MPLGCFTKIKNALGWLAHFVLSKSFKCSCGYFCLPSWWPETLEQMWLLPFSLLKKGETRRWYSKIQVKLQRVEASHLQNTTASKFVFLETYETNIFWEANSPNLVRPLHGAPLVQAGTGTAAGTSHGCSPSMCLGSAVCLEFIFFAALLQWGCISIKSVNCMFGELYLSKAV